MVSKANEDLPEPEIPEMTTNWSRGISTVRFFRLWARAPTTTIFSWGMAGRIGAGEGLAAPLTLGLAGGGARLALGAGLQGGRLLDPTVQLGRHAHDIQRAQGGSARTAGGVARG